MKVSNKNFIFRCADKILNQLEIHADAALNINGTNKNHQKRNAILFGDIADRANANFENLDNFKPASAGSKPRKSVTFKDC